MTFVLLCSFAVTRAWAVSRTAALLTGSGLGIAVNATQYSSFSCRTNNAGDTLGIVNGAASTILSIMAAKRQKGPNGSVGDVANMLAPLLGGAPVLNTYYPPAVLQSLQSVPPDDLTHGARLDELKQSWIKSGRLDSSSARQSSKPPQLRPPARTRTSKSALTISRTEWQ